MDKKYKFDMFGDQVMAALSFVKSRFNKRKKIFDSVNEEMVLGKDLFLKQGERWFLRQESLPGDLCIKALAVDSSGIYLETAPIVKKEVIATITDRRIPVYLQGNKFIDKDGRDLIQLGPIKAVGGKNRLAPRILWTIKWTALNNNQQELAIRAIDAIYTAGAYSMKDLPGLSYGAGVSNVFKLELRTDLMLQLNLEQRPILSTSTEMRLEIKPIMALQYQILNMSAEEIIEWTEKQLQTEEGQKKVFNAFVFVLAGKVKNVSPDVSWKQARIIARNLISIQ